MAQVVFDHVEFLSPKLNKPLDNYPTVTIKVKEDKENNESEKDYLKRFRVHYYWFHLAKSVARYVDYDLVESFMRPFNDPNYHCFTVENTAIAVDLMESRSSFGHHTEVALNLLLFGKEWNYILSSAISREECYWWRIWVGKEGCGGNWRWWRCQGEGGGASSSQMMAVMKSIRQMQTVTTRCCENHTYSIRCKCRPSLTLSYFIFQSSVT